MSCYTLLKHRNRSVCVTGIFQASRANKFYFDNLYQFAINNFARLVQQLPASEVDHHAYPGGLLDHALESALNALRIRRAHTLPTDAPTEDISRDEALWTYAIFAAALLHDIGKVAIDQNITVYDRKKRELSDWSPFTGFMDESASWYSVNFRTDRQYGLHQRTAAMLLTQILPATGITWIASNTEIFGAFSAALTAQSNEAGLLGEIVDDAERLSVARDKGAGHRSYMAARTKPLHEKLLQALRVLLDNGELSLNRPGAAGWLKDHALWLMGTRTVSSIRQQLTEEGHSGIPSSNSRLFDVLMQHGIVVANPDEQAIWRVQIELGNWKPEPFTVLRIPPEKIWLARDQRPQLFEGTVEVLDGSCLEKHEGTSGSDNATNTASKDRTADASITQEPQKDPIKSQYSEKLVYGPWFYASRDGVTETKVTQIEEISGTTNSNEVQSPENLNLHSEKSACGKIFFEWLVTGLKEGQIRYNHADAVVHVVTEGILLVSPAIFRWFAKDHSEYDSWSNVQKQVQRLRLNQKAADKTNIHRYKVVGENRPASVLNGFLVADKTLLFGDKVPNANPHLVATTESR